MLPFAKKKFSPPQYEAFIEDEGDEFQVRLMFGGVQVGGAVFPDDGHGEAFELAKVIADDWVKNNGGMGAQRPI